MPEQRPDVTKRSSVQLILSLPRRLKIGSYRLSLTDAKRRLMFVHVTRTRAIHVTLLPKSPQWDGKPRNTGIELGKGDYIVYLDNDDYYGPQHLEIIDAGLNGYDWVCYNDWVFNGDWVQRHCDIKKLGANGTSNVCHRRTLGVKWGYRGYAHDHHFNQSLLKFKNYAKIDAGQYFVMHLPHGTDL